jgi:16S rRNA (guanine527-N7)-methyltransferase
VDFPTEERIRSRVTELTECSTWNIVSSPSGGCSTWNNLQEGEPAKVKEELPMSLEGDFARLKRDLEGFPLAFSPVLWSQLREYGRLLYRWSEHMNLVSPKDRERLASKHIRRALMAVPMILTVPHRTVLDIGSGAGLPAIPLKMIFPGSVFVLIESRRRRAHFLKEVVRHLELKGIEVINERIESWKDGGKKFDLATARAVAGPEKLFSWIGERLAPHGCLMVSLSANSRNRQKAVILVKQAVEKGGEKAVAGLLSRGFST